jgi:hypothetical protein
MSKVSFKEETATVPTPPSGYVVFYAKADSLMYFKADDGVERALKNVGAGTGDLLSDGSVGLTAPWDVGPHKITAEQLESDVATGTAPLIVASTTVVANLNVSQLEGNAAADIVLVAATSLAAAGFFLDEDDLVSDDDTKVASQQSVKAYVDAAAGGDSWGDVVDAVITPDADGTRDFGLTGTRFAEGFFDDIDVTTNIIVGGTVDGRDVEADGAVLDAIDTGYLGQNLQTGTSYELVLTDAGKIVEMNNASANVLTIPANAAVAFPVDTRIDIIQYGAGETSVTITSDTLRGELVSVGQYKFLSLWKRAATEWVIAGGTT